MKRINKKRREPVLQNVLDVVTRCYEAKCGIHNSVLMKHITILLGPCSVTDEVNHCLSEGVSVVDQRFIEKIVASLQHRAEALDVVA